MSLPVMRGVQQPADLENTSACFVGMLPYFAILTRIHIGQQTVVSRGGQGGPEIRAGRPCTLQDVKEAEQRPAPEF